MLLLVYNHNKKKTNDRSKCMGTFKVGNNNLDLCSWKIITKSVAFTYDLMTIVALRGSSVIVWILYETNTVKYTNIFSIFSFSIYYEFIYVSGGVHLFHMKERGEKKLFLGKDSVRDKIRNNELLFFIVLPVMYKIPEYCELWWEALHGSLTKVGDCGSDYHLNEVCSSKSFKLQTCQYENETWVLAD